MDGFVLIDKPVGVSSFYAIKVVKKIYNTNKVGHCGTLDPFASGLLVIGVNKATKVLPYIDDNKKEYIAKIKLGETTDTLDLTGKVIASKEIIKPSVDELLNVINSFKGDINQVPPIYSAIRVNGMHLYDYARQNIEVEIKNRMVSIYDIKLLSFVDNVIELYVKCSKGTYIRTLGYDIAKKLNNEGHLIDLRRVSIGNFKVCNANPLKEFDGKSNVISIQEATNLPIYHVSSDELLKKIYNGQCIEIDSKSSTILIVKNNKEALAIYKKDSDNKYKCARGLFNESDRY